MNLLRAALADALAVVLPVDCCGCGAAGRSVCADCAAALTTSSSRREIGGTAVFSGCAYADETARMVASFKDSGRVDAAPALAEPLRRAVGRALADTARPGGPSIVHAVPVPSTRSAYRRRGFDPVVLLARRAGLPTHRVLRLARRVADQAGLGADDRRRNRDGALEARVALTGRHVLLLDDVVTTGATLGDAARAVTEAGGVVVAAATVAATPMRRPGPAPTLMPASEGSLWNPYPTGLRSAGRRR